MICDKVSRCLKCLIYVYDKRLKLLLHPLFSQLLVSLPFFLIQNCLNTKQAVTVLGQAQLKLKLEPYFTSFKICCIREGLKKKLVENSST